MRDPPATVFLDQNKWIDLAHAFESPKAYSKIYEIGCGIVDALQSGRLQFPLTSSVIIETYRMANDGHRSLIAEIQAKISQGRVFRDRNFLIRHEILRFLNQKNLVQLEEPPKLWWMSKYFVEAFVDIPSAVMQMGLEDDQVIALQADPIFALYHFVSTAPRDERMAGMGMWESGAKELISTIEQRRQKLFDYKPSMHKRAYSATLALGEQERVISVFRAAGVDWNAVTHDDPKILKGIISDVPSYQAEIALACTIERLNRPINSNDLRDMTSYVTAIPYADIVVGEKLFVNLAVQSGLGKKFRCALNTNLSDLEAHL